MKHLAKSYKYMIGRNDGLHQSRVYDLDQPIWSPGCNLLETEKTKIVGQ